MNLVHQDGKFAREKVAWSLKGSGPRYGKFGNERRPCPREEGKTCCHTNGDAGSQVQEDIQVFIPGIDD